MFICSRTKFETITVNVFTFKHNYRFTIFVLLIGVFLLHEVIIRFRGAFDALVFLFFFVIWFARIQQLGFLLKK